MATGAHGLINLPALFILLMLTLLLIRGIQESATVNAIIVVLKVAIVILIITLGWGFMSAANHTPYIPPAGEYTDKLGVVHDYGGWKGIVGAAGIVFFAFIGFDAVSTAAQETKNPKRDMPIGILGSLAVCTVLYVLFAHVLTGLAPVDFFRNAGSEASVAKAIDQFMPGYRWLSNAVTVAILGGFSSVILVMLLGQSRVFYSMSRDGLVPALFSDVHPRYKTPYKSNWVFFGFVGPLRRLHSRGHRRQHDEHRDALRVHPGVHRGVGHAREGARRGAAVPRAGRAGGVDPRRARRAG